MTRSIIAVAVGFVLIGALSVGADTLVHQLAPGAYDGVRMTSVPLLTFSTSEPDANGWVPVCVRP